MRNNKKTIDRFVSIIKNGGIGVIPTDTLYGLVGSALMPKTVERIYRVRRRDKHKPMIVLIGSTDDLSLFGITPNKNQFRHMKRFWPGPVSFIFPCPKKKFSYLHRGTGTIAFRMPANLALRRFLSFTGPLVAPSANKERVLPARSIRQAREYFGDSVDFYIAGKVKKKASTVVDLTNEEVSLMRE